MKEVDFLPVWYKSGRRRQVSYRAQYITLGGIVVVMVLWNVIVAHSIFRAKGEVAQMAAAQAEVKVASAEYDRIKGQLKAVQERAAMLEHVDSRIDVASVLGELSFLLDKSVVLSKVELKAEGFSESTERKSKGRGVVRSAGGNVAGRGRTAVGDVRFRVVIGGVTSDASDVADLICRLEDSPYFCQVVPLFSRNKEIKSRRSDTGKGYQVSEFEVSCVLANYDEARIFAKEQR